MAILKGGTIVNGDLVVDGLITSDSGLRTSTHVATLVPDSITARTNQLIKFSADDENLALSIISDTGTAVTIGTSVADHTLHVKGALRLYDTDISHSVLITAGDRTTDGTFTLPNVTAGTVATINNAATWTAVQTHSADITMSGTAELVGNAKTATTLKAPRAINGVNFNGSAPVTIPVNVATVPTTPYPTAVYPLLVTGTGNVPAYLQNESELKFYYEPATGTLHAPIISGVLRGEGVVAEVSANLSGTGAFTIPYQTDLFQENNVTFRTTSYVSANTATTRKFLMMTGTGSAGTAPTWAELGTISGTGATWQANVIAVKYGGTGLASLATNTIYKGNGEGALVASGITDNGSTIALAANRSFSMPSGTGTFSQVFSGTATTTSFASYHSGVKGGTFSAFNFSNSATSTAASAIKSSLFVLSEGSWAGASAQNRAVYSRATGGTTNYSFYGDGGTIYNKGSIRIDDESGNTGFEVKYNNVVGSLDFNFVG